MELDINLEYEIISVSGSRRRIFVSSLILQTKNFSGNLIKAELLFQPLDNYHGYQAHPFGDTGFLGKLNRDFARLHPTVAANLLYAFRFRDATSQMSSFIALESGEWEI